MRPGRLGSEALDLVLLVGSEVPLEPVPAGRVLIGSLPSEDVCGHAVEEPAVVGDDHGTAGELQQGVLQRPQGLDVEVVGGLVQEDEVAALLRVRARLRRLRSPPESTPAGFCWSAPLKPKEAT